MKRPAFQFYPADWRKDPALSVCSLAARGLWIEMMCVAHESEFYGRLAVNGKPMNDPQIARLVGESPAVVSKLLKELEDAGVFSRDEQGCIYSRRMVKDERLRNVRADAGRLGGNPNLLKQKDKQTDKQILTPSSSSSSSDIEEANASLSPAELDDPDRPAESLDDEDLDDEGGRLPACPHRELIDLFGKQLPQLAQPKPELWAGKNADAMRARWRWVLTAKKPNGKRYATSREEALDFFDRFFGYVATCPHLVGQNSRGWEATLAWLVTAGNFTKVMEGNYAPRAEEVAA